MGWRGLPLLLLLLLCGLARGYVLLPANVSHRTDKVCPSLPLSPSPSLPPSPDPRPFSPVTLTPFLKNRGGITCPWQLVLVQERCMDIHDWLVSYQLTQ